MKSFIAILLCFHFQTEASCPINFTRDRLLVRFYRPKTSNCLGYIVRFLQPITLNLLKLGNATNVTMRQVFPFKEPKLFALHTYPGNNRLGVDKMGIVRTKRVHIYIIKLDLGKYTLRRAT